MGNKTRISDEQILAALISNVGAVTHAAESVGCSPRTIWQRMQNPDFRKRLDDYRKKNLQAACLGLEAATMHALTTAVDIMQDIDTPPAVRLSACKLILDNVLKFDTQLVGAETRESREGMLSSLIDGLRILDEPDEDSD